MNRLILVLLLLSFAALQPVPAQDAGTDQPRMAGVDLCAVDGRAAAPAGTAQYPALLNGYAYRSPCKVAGVDYAVGIPTGRGALKDPRVPANLPTPCSLSGTLLRCDNSNGVVLEDFDFSLGGGIGLNLVNADNITLRYNKFVVGSSCRNAILQDTASDGIIIEYNLVDGGGGTISDACAVTASDNTKLRGTGQKRLRYNHFRNASQHSLSFEAAGGGATDGGALDLRFNLIERCGFYQGSHCNGGQFVGGNWVAPVVAFNTLISGQPDTPSAAITGTFKRGSPTISGITLVNGAGNENSFHVGMGLSGASIPGGALIRAVTAGNSPVITMSANATASSTTTFTVTNAYPFGMVVPIYLGSQLGGRIYNGLVQANTVITTAPIQGVSFAIVCAVEGGDPGNINSGARIDRNFLALEGAFGGFYPSRICSGVWTGNRNMSTGAVISGPKD